MFANVPTAPEIAQVEILIEFSNLCLFLRNSFGKKLTSLNQK